MMPSGPVQRMIAKQASYFEVGTVVLYGKYKNHRGIVKSFGKDKWGNPTVEVEPVPKGRKQNKIFGLFRLWRADVKEKALAEAQALLNPVVKLSMETPRLRLVARYIQAFGIDVGRTVNVGDIRIHRYSEMFQITDLTNAGKRGKKVKIMNVTLGYGSKVPYKEHETWFDGLGKALVNQTSFDGVRNYLTHVKEEEPYLDWSIREVRGIDIEPTGAKISLKTNTGLEIESAPNDFRVLHRWALTHPKTGKPNGFQDTNYYSRSKESAAVFFTWLKSNLSKVNTMEIGDLRNLWNDLDIKYDSH